MALTTYAELQASIADWLLRTDLTVVIPDFITLVEARMSRDPRVRKIVRTDPFTIDAETETIPSGMVELDSLTLDGDNLRYGSLDVVGVELLQDYHRLYGTTGMPRAVAMVDGSFYFAPVPDQSYDAVITYKEGVTALSDGNTTNWILTAHPDVYLFGSLMMAAPYMKDDQRIQIWSAAYEQGVEEIHQALQNSMYSGNLRRRVLNPIP